MNRVMAGKTFIMSDELFGKYFGFKSINIEGDYKLFFYRYIPYSRLKEMLDSCEIAFVNPALWADPYETLYLNADFSDIGDYKRGKIFCLCVGTTIDSEEASWKVYSKDSDPLVRVKFNLIKLAPKLKEFAKKNMCNVYWSKIDYSLDGSQLMDIYKDEKLKRKYLMNFSEEKYIRLMSLKRPAYKYEGEHRFFIVPQGDPPLEIYQKDIVKLPIDASIFLEFMIHPIDRIMKNDKEWHIKRTNYMKEVEEISSYIRSKLPEAIVDYSRLYESVGNITSIRIKRTNS